jgi:hypothetical protein
MKIKIETIIVVIGVCIVLAMSGILKESIIWASGCSQGCGTPTSPCDGTNITACSSYSGLSNCGASCSNNYSGKNYRNTPVSGTTSGTSKISYVSEPCVVTTQCVAGTPHPGQKCQIEALGITICHSINAAPTDICYSCSAGGSSTSYIYNCSTSFCTEE